MRMPNFKDSLSTLIVLKISEKEKKEILQDSEGYP